MVHSIQYRGLIVIKIYIYGALIGPFLQFVKLNLALGLARTWAFKVERVMGGVGFGSSRAGPSLGELGNWLRPQVKGAPKFQKIRDRRGKKKSLAGVGAEKN